MRRIRSHLTYANVMATLAVFLVLGGGAYAAFHLPRNSVRSKNIVNGQVKQPDLARPQKAKSAGLPDTQSNSGCTNSSDNWENFRTSDPVQPYRVGFYRDPYGRVFLQGTFINCQPTLNANPLFTLPRGYRPSNILWETVNELSTAGDTYAIAIEPGGVVDPLFIPAGRVVDIDGLSFRCGPSGKHGCP
jgi:hypothetical protein